MQIFNNENYEKLWNFMYVSQSMFELTNYRQGHQCTWKWVWIEQLLSERQLQDHLRPSSTNVFSKSFTESFHQGIPTISECVCPIHEDHFKKSQRHCKTMVVLIWTITTQEGWNFVRHDSDELSWHVQNSDLIITIKMIIGIKIKAKTLLQDLMSSS